jgi:hypothetical protein
MSLEGAGSAALEEPQVVDTGTPEPTPEPSSDVGDLAHLADTGDDDFHTDEPSTGEPSDTPASDAVPAAQPELPPEVQAKLKRAEELERQHQEYQRSTYVQQALARQAQEDAYKAQLAQQEQAETRAVYGYMQRLGAEAEALAQAGRLDEAEGKRIEALGALNEYNSRKAEERLMAKIQAAQAQQNQAAQSFQQDVQQFLADPNWGGTFCDPKKPEESQRIAMWAADLKAKGYPQQGIYQMLSDAKSFYGGPAKTQTNVNASAVADRARVQAAMESPTGGHPVTPTKDDDKATGKAYTEFLGSFMGRRPK